MVGGRNRFSKVGMDLDQYPLSRVDLRVSSFESRGCAVIYDWTNTRNGMYECYTLAAMPAQNYFFLKKSLIFFMPVVLTFFKFLTPRLSFALRFFSSSTFLFFSARASSSSSSSCRLRE